MANNPVAISKRDENVDVHTATWNTIFWSLPSNGASSSLRHNAVSPSHFLWPPLGVLAVHSLFLYSDPPPPSDWLRLFLSQTLSHIYIYPQQSQPGYSSYLHCLWRWDRQCSETSAHKIQMGQSVPKHQHIKLKWNRKSVPKRRHIKFRQNRVLRNVGT